MTPLPRPYGSGWRWNEDVHACTPDELVSAAEEGREPGAFQDDPETDPVEFDVRRETLEDVLVYLFAEGPHPATVLQRAFALAMSQAPKLLGAIPGADLRMILADTPAGRRWRVCALVGRSATGRRRVDAKFALDRIDYVLRKNYQRELSRGHDPQFPYISLDSVIAGDSSEDPADYSTAAALPRVVRRETIRALVGYFFRSGASPLVVVQRVFALCRAWRSDLLLNMPLEDQGMMFGYTRASESERVRRFINRELSDAGFKGFKLPWQKSEEASEAYRVSQLGNNNRRGGRKEQQTTP